MEGKNFVWFHLNLRFKEKKKVKYPKTQ